MKCSIESFTQYREPGFEKNFRRESRTCTGYRHRVALFLALFSTFQYGLSAEIPKSSGHDPRIGELAYEHDEIFQIRVATGVATHIILGEGERIVASAPGTPGDCREGAEWCIVAKSGSNELFVQPRTAAAQGNNLQLSTNVRRYSFEFLQSPLQGGPGPWYRVTFHYAPDAGSGSVGACNWNYTMPAATPDASVMPLAVFDDGVRTYVMLSPQVASQPAATDSAGPMRILGGGPGRRMMVLERVTDRFELRAGGAAVSVWNEGLGPSAPRRACPAW